MRGSHILRSLKLRHFKMKERKEAVDMREVCSIELHLSCSESWPIIGLQDDLFLLGYGCRSLWLSRFLNFLKVLRVFLYLFAWSFPSFPRKTRFPKIWGRQPNYYRKEISETLQMERFVLSRHTCTHSETDSSVWKLETVKSSLLHAWTWIFPFDMFENEGEEEA